MSDHDWRLSPVYLNVGVIPPNHEAQLLENQMNLKFRKKPVVSDRRMATPKITLKLVRSFSLGFTILSPKLNGVCFNVNVACFEIAFWNRGSTLFGFHNYWNA